MKSLSKPSIFGSFALTITLLVTASVAQAQFSTPGAPSPLTATGSNSGQSRIPLGRLSYFYYDDENGQPLLYTAIDFSGNDAAFLSVPMDVAYWDITSVNSLNGNGWNWQIRPNLYNPIQWNGFALEMEVPPMILVPYMPTYVDNTQVNKIPDSDFGSMIASRATQTTSYSFAGANFGHFGGGEYYSFSFDNPTLVLDHDSGRAQVETADGLVLIDVEFTISDQDGAISFLNVSLNIETGQGFVNEWYVELLGIYATFYEPRYLPVTFEVSN